MEQSNKITTMGIKNKYGNGNSRAMERNKQLLLACKEYWDGLHYVREERRRNRDFRNGIQWTSQELEAIKRQGNNAIENNYIALMIRNLMGQYIANSQGMPVAVARKKEAADISRVMTLALEHIVDINDDMIKDRDMLEDLILGGVACSKVYYDWIFDKDCEDVVTQNINLNRLFFNTDIYDTSLANLDTIGEICDCTIDYLVSEFAETQEDRAFLLREYGYNDRNDERRYLETYYSSYTRQGSSILDNMDFLIPSNPKKARYYIIWERERRSVLRYHDTMTANYGISELNEKEIDDINMERVSQYGEDAKLIKYERRAEFVWKYKYLTPKGIVLKEGDSPYKHQSHPYVLAFYNIIDGKIHPMISDVIAQQRYINRLIMQMDFMMCKAAKGVLFVPKQLLQNGGNEMDMKELAKTWSSFDGVYAYDAKPGIPLPTQIYAQTNVGQAASMFQTQLNMMQEILGVNKAIQGQATGSNTPASRYAQETLNSQLNSRDLFERFSNYRKAKYSKISKLTLQYYSKGKFANLAAKEDLQFDENFDRINWDISISQENINGSYAMTESDQLYNMLLNGMIDLQTYLSVSPAGYAENLSNIIKKREQELQEQQAILQMPQIPEEQLQQQQAEQQQMQSPQLSEEQLGMIEQMINSAVEKRLAEAASVQVPQEQTNEDITNEILANY